MVGQLVLILLITNFGLFLLLRFLFRQQLEVAIQRLQKLHQENLDREAELKREYELAKQEHQKEVEKGKDEAARLKELAKESANRLKDEVLLRAKEEAESMIAAGRKESEHYKEKAKDEIREKAIQISLELIKSTFSNKDMESLHEQFIDEVIAVIDKADDPRFHVQAEEAKILTAFKINEEQKAALSACLNKKAAHQINLTVTKDEGIIAGLVINLGDLILDASLENRLRKAISFL